MNWGSYIAQVSGKQWLYMVYIILVGAAVSLGVNGFFQAMELRDKLSAAISRISILEKKVRDLENK